MKKLLLIFFSISYYFVVGQNVGSYYNTTFATVPYTALGAGTTTVLPANSLNSLTVIAMPITSFSYGCIQQPSVVISSNGWMSFNTALAPTAGPNANNDLDNITNNFSTPNIIAPLWDALRTQTLVGTGKVHYLVSGAVGTRTMTIEWLNMQWGNLALTATSRISFQVWLYETTNIIEFRYRRDNTGTQADPIPSANASIGLMGATTGDFISINPLPTPAASNSIETSTISSRPALSALYRFTPILCSGTPTAGTAKATPSLSCSNYTTTLSLTGNSGGCGVTYQWFHCNTAGGTYTSVAAVSSVPTQTFAITSATAKFFKCDVACGGTIATTPTITASVGPGAAGVGSFSLAPFTSTTFNNQSTCGFANDLYATGTGSVAVNCFSTTAFNAGSDVVYAFTPTITSAFTATLSQPASGEDLNMTLYNGCPTSTGACVSTNTVGLSAGGTTTRSVGTCTNVVVANNTYYLVIDAKSTGLGGCNTYSLNMGLAAMPTSTASTACALGYTASTITYTNTVFTGTQLRPSMTDDALSNYIPLFDFCFDGNYYNGGYVSDNSSFVFATLPCLPNVRSTSSATPGVTTGYTISTTAPAFGTDIPRNAILAPWQALSPIASTVVASKIQYTVLGAVESRTAIISWESIPMSSCTASLANTQIRLFENDSKIEIHVGNKRACATFNGGKAILGLHNYNGTVFVPAAATAGFNGSAAWTLTNTAYRFTSTCSSNTTCAQILPIGFTNFYGDRIDNINTLFWNTALEEDMNYFSIEKSYDALEFTEIAKISAKNEPSSYTYQDYDNPAGMIAYYRIKAIENDGKYSYTHMVSIGLGNDEILSTSPLFPNPTNTEVNIRLNSKKTGVANFIIYDIYGNVITNKQERIEVGVTVHAVNVESLKAGVYSLEIQNNLNEVITKQKLVIQ